MLSIASGFEQLLTLPLLEGSNALASFVNDWASVVGFLITWFGFLYVYMKKRSRWARKNFTEQVNFSLNYVENGQLQLRTVMEDTALRVWLNEYGVKKVLQAADRTTVEQPFMSLEDQSDMSYLKRAVLNVLSEQFAQVFVARALGENIPTREFIFGITCEKYGDLETQKVRVMLIRRQALEEIFSDPEKAEALVLAEPRHQDRVTTLREMHRLLHSLLEKERSMLGVVELGVIV